MIAKPPHDTPFEIVPSNEPKVTHILVSESAFNSPDPTLIVLETVRFVNFMLSDGGFKRAELPHAAFLSYHVDYYLAQVSNGGHGQFVGNSRWNPYTIADCSEGLRLMRADPYTEIFEDLRTLIDGDAARAKAIAEGCGFGEIDPAIKALDGRYFAQDAYKVLPRANAEWLRGLPEIKVVPDADVMREMQALANANPQGVARRLARGRAALQATLTDHLQVAARLLCAEARRLPVLSIPAGKPAAVAPDGREGIAWGVNTPTGMHSVFLFDDVALLCDQYLADGRLLTSNVVGEARARMDQGDFNYADFAEISYKEVARIKTALVHDAIAHAQNANVVGAAECALAKAAPSDRMVEVWAAAKSKDGYWLWQIFGAQSVYFMAFMPKGIQVWDYRMKPLTKFSARELGAFGGTSPADAPTSVQGMLPFLFSFKGRIARLPYLAASMLLGVLSAVYISVMVGPSVAWLGTKGIPEGTSKTEVLALLWPLFPVIWMQVALAAKRLHDLNISMGHYCSQWFVVTVYSLVTPLVIRLAKDSPSGWNLAIALLAYALFLGLTLYLLWLMIKMMFFKGTPWANRYGAGPLRPTLRWM